MNLLFPEIERSSWREYLRLSAQGALIAGVYGALHDQVTWTLSAEYFTEVKFEQFGYADFGWGPRAFAGTVGLLATWWVGLIAGWFLARLALPRFPVERARAAAHRGFAMVFGCGLTGGLAGYAIGRLRVAEGIPEAWHPLIRQLGLEQPQDFVVVAHIHNGGYLGALVGLVIAGLWIASAQGAKGRILNDPHNAPRTNLKRNESPDS